MTLRSAPQAFKERTSLLPPQAFENRGSFWKSVSKTNHDNDTHKVKLEEEEQGLVTSGSSQPSLL